MTGAEWSCWLDFLGLDNRWAAKQFGVTERTVKRWAQRDTVPDAAAHAMRRWIDYTNQFVSRLTITLTQSTDAGRPNIVAPEDDCADLVTGMPPRWHRMISTRVAERTGFSIVWKP